MTILHPDPYIAEMQWEVPLRSDLQEMPLSPDNRIAEDQLIMRWAIPVPLSEQIPLIKRIKIYFGKLF